LATQPYQRRDVLPIHSEYGQSDCGGPTGLYTPLSTARFMADDALGRIEGFTDEQAANRTGLMGKAALYAGLSYATFAEGFCSAAFDLGPEILPPANFELARQRFTTALERSEAVGDLETLNAARVG